jgi:hypothetical protein
MAEKTKQLASDKTGGTAEVDAFDPTPIEWFVADMAGELGLGERSVDRRCRRILERLTRWATAEGLPLDREVILDPATVERFCHVAMAGDRSQATHRSDLRRMAPKLTRAAPWEPRPAAMAVRTVAPPYTEREVALLQIDAANQPSAVRRRSALAFLALGLGAGLDGRWVGSVKAADVGRRGDVVEARVGPPAPRAVVVRADWEDDVLRLADTAGAQYLMGGTSTSRHRVASKVKRLVRPTNHPALSPARLRSTWLLNHLTAGTRLPELCQAAGFDGLTTLTDLLACVPALPPDLADAMLRGGQ